MQRERVGSVVVGCELSVTLFREENALGFPEVLHRWSFSSVQSHLQAVYIQSFGIGSHNRWRA